MIILERCDKPLAFEPECKYMMIGYINEQGQYLHPSQVDTTDNW